MITFNPVGIGYGERRRRRGLRRILPLLAIGAAGVMVYRRPEIIDRLAEGVDRVSLAIARHSPAVGTTLPPDAPVWFPRHIEPPPAPITPPGEDPLAILSKYAPHIAIGVGALILLKMVIAK